jgi:hypothetical protein
MLRMPLRAHRTVRCLLVALLSAAMTVATAAQSAHAATPPFSPSSVWNKPLSSTTPLAPDSAALVIDLKRQVDTYRAWINTNQFSTPVYTVPANQPRVRGHAGHDISAAA